MNRVIKFRVWDGNKMFYLDALDEKTNHYLECGSAGFWAYCSTDGSKITSTNDGGSLMQFTGLIDKNGKGIYEGDICKFTSYTGGFKHTGQVVYDSEDACFEFEDLERTTYCDKSFTYQRRSKVTHHSFDVIGNIYENKELLTNK